MFTGLIQETGTVQELTVQGTSARLAVLCPVLYPSLSIGDSVAINGACQTVVGLPKDFAEFDTLAESLEKTNLGQLRSGNPVNLEASLTPSTPMGGHFVQGHVNGTGRIAAIESNEQNIYIRVDLPSHLLDLCVEEGSIAVDGISLTTARIDQTGITVNVIPHTMQHTNLRIRKTGDMVNIETDIIARYVARLLQRGLSSADSRKTTLTADRLHELGYGDKV